MGEVWGPFSSRLRVRLRVRLRLSVRLRVRRRLRLSLGTVTKIIPTEHHRQATTSKIAWTMTMKIAVKPLCLGSSEALSVQAKSRNGDAGSKRRLR